MTAFVRTQVARHANEGTFANNFSFANNFARSSAVLGGGYSYFTRNLRFLSSGWSQSWAFCL